jgi:hypothetical protein
MVAGAMDVDHANTDWESRRLGSHEDPESWTVLNLWAWADEAQSNSIRHRNDPWGKAFSCVLE